MTISIPVSLLWVIAAIVVVIVLILASVGARFIFGVMFQGCFRMMGKSVMFDD